MQLSERITVLNKLKLYIESAPTELEEAILKSRLANPWFTDENVRFALSSIAESYLSEEKLHDWLQSYNIPETTSPMKKIGLVLAGNIPLVGFYDVLCTFLAGQHALIKLSEKDSHLLPLFIKKMTEWSPEVSNYFSFCERLLGFDAVIATGSDNSARYFEAYFGKYPHVIRRNRNAVAVLDGTETFAELLALGDDVFRYFGLGCRNVSKLYVPKDYKFDVLLEAFDAFMYVTEHNKYKNNFDYNYTLLLINNIAHHSNGSILLTESKNIQSRIALLHYETYDDTKALAKLLQQQNEQIQCVVSQKTIDGVKTIPLGAAQKPSLNDYADGIDIMTFLINLN